MELDYIKMKAEAVELLQKLIQNKCVNYETKESGQEMRSVKTLVEYFEGYGINEYEIFESAPGRGNLLLRMKGNGGESLMYESHLDVVPVSEESWENDPFAGEILDGYIWGRGAIDMLYFTASQAVAFAHLFNAGFKPKGDLIFLAVADEEAGGEYGAEWLVQNNADKIKADYMIGEFGGSIIDTPGGRKIGFTTGEKGPAWFEMIINGEPGHASMPYGANNAINTYNEILYRIRRNPPKPVIIDAWRDFVAGLELPGFLSFMLTHKSTLPLAIKLVARRDIGLAKVFHALTRMTIQPTIVNGGTKSNIIPDKVTQVFDVRLLPGQTEDTLIKYLQTTLGDLFNQVKIETKGLVPGSSDPWETSLLDSVRQVTKEISPEVEVTPLFLPAVTDSRIFRKIGIKCYGYSILGDSVQLKDLTSLAHGDNERIPIEAVEKSTELFAKLALDFLQ